jgi:SAM-dependent methyltransferase
MQRLIVQSDIPKNIVPELIKRNLDILCCPACGGGLKISSNFENLQCTECARSFPSAEGVPLLFLPNEWKSEEDVTETVKSFYEETPFPNYDGLDSAWSLRQKAQEGIFANLLDQEIPHGARILEAGCGTGQLSNFLGTSWGRVVFGTDICLNSLKLAQQFREKNQIDNAAFLQMNLFRPAFKPETFDLVISNGVLHHTSNPFLGFQSILKLVKKGGFIIIGLYNKYGRIPTDVRRFIFRLSGNRLQFLDYRVRDARLNAVVKKTWFMDQYKNPHESKHTIAELLKWFDQCDVDFINSIPKPRLLEHLQEGERLFQATPRGGTVDHFLVQLGMLLSGGKEGGFFIGIGRKK